MSLALSAAARQSTVQALADLINARAGEELLPYTPGWYVRPKVALVGPSALFIQEGVMSPRTAHTWDGHWQALPDVTLRSVTMTVPLRRKREPQWVRCTKYGKQYRWSEYAVACLAGQRKLAQCKPRRA